MVPRLCRIFKDCYVFASGRVRQGVLEVMHRKSKIDITHDMIVSEWYYWMDIHSRASHRIEERLPIENRCLGAMIKPIGHFVCGPFISYCFVRMTRVPRQPTSTRPLLVCNDHKEPASAHLFFIAFVSTDSIIHSATLLRLSLFSALSCRPSMRSRIPKRPPSPPFATIMDFSKTCSYQTTGY